ncbi:Calcium-independent phospholipase A2-gamma-like [Oopsacas minuta]|uniref:Calcium-independent phospholipase A2-gamma-like n=1 Tax=Oopsacas minuta TaxID=111878 RepID=A0AAV7K665_9METZ|nr:Calcium-independent phospholipase A2-gamma-like [Oopsacas minuta]
MLMRSRYVRMPVQLHYSYTTGTRFSHGTVNKYNFNSHLRTLINTLPPYPFRARPTYSPRVDTLLDQITPTLHSMTFQQDASVTSFLECEETKRLLKLTSFQLHRHRRALDQRNLYLGLDIDKISADEAKPFATYTRKLDQVLSLIGWGSYPKGSGVRILALDGGGSRGLVAIELLSALEQCTGQRLRDMFDLVYGTSTGAIIIFLHFVCKIELSDCIKIYQKFSHQIFTQSTFGAAYQIWSTHSIYNAELLREFLSEQKTTQLPMWVTPSSSSQPRLGVVATHVGDTPQPYIFRNFRIPSVSKYEGVCDVKWIDAILASTAAPGYFAEYCIGSSAFQDGGLVANNPSALAIHEASILWPEHKIQCLVSIGTGKMSNFESLVETASSSSDDKDSQGINILSITDKLRVLFYCITSSSNGTHDTLSDLLPMLGVPYFRLNPGFSKEVPMDESREEELNLIIQETKKYINHNKIKFANMREALFREPSGLTNFFKQIQMSK